jgi:hypothetical protein
MADGRSDFYVENCTGTGNAVGIQSQYGSMISVSGTIPWATLSERQIMGGQIVGNTPFVYLRSGGLTLPASSSMLDLPIGTVVEDSYGLKSGNSVVISKPGWYHINLLMTIQDLSSTARVSLSAFKNGTQFTDRQVVGFGTGNVTYLTMNDQQYFVKGDVITLKDSKLVVRPLPPIILKLD